MLQLCVGIGRETITPPIGTMLAGYAPVRPAVSVHDDLHVTAFAFQTQEERALLVSADLCSIPKKQEQVRQALAETAGIPAERVIIACTHTHSGPHSAWDLDESPNYLFDRFVPSARKAVADALASLRPAQMGIGIINSDVAVNRRQITEEGKIKLGQNPYGSYDPAMTVVAFREPDGTPIGNLIHYGCHNTGSGKNDAITRDWCGVAIDRLEEVTGGVTAFVNGCGGDCGPRLANGKTTGNLQMAMELGGRAAVDAVRAWRSIRLWQDAPLKVHCGQINMPLQKLGTVEQILEQAAAFGDPQLLKGTRKGSYQRLVERAQWLKEGNIPPTTRQLTHTVIALGPLALLPIPFEPFSMITLRIKDASPFPYTLCVGYANGALSYFPSMDQIVRGGYEVEMFLTRNQVPFAEDSEQHYVAGSLQLLRQLYEQA